MIIAVKKDSFSKFDTDEYLVDLDRRFGGYQKGDLICYVRPFYPLPLILYLAIRVDGSIAFRNWNFTNDNLGNAYLQTNETPENFTATQEQIDTVNGLWSGRVLFEGLKLPIGGTMQAICPIDKVREESLLGKNIRTC